MASLIVLNKHYNKIKSTNSDSAGFYTKRKSSIIGHLKQT